MSSVIECPECKNKLSLPAHVDGQRVQCPSCRLDFQPHALPSLSVDVGPTEPTPVAIPPAEAPLLKPAMDSAYAPAPGRASRVPARGSVYCNECGTQYARTAAACPECGFSVKDLEYGEVSDRRLPRARELRPINGLLPIIGAILFPVGMLFIAAVPITIELIFRRPPRPEQVMIILSLVGTGLLLELAALILCTIWLYQAWRLVLHGDEEYSPGLMIGLLFVPFFNFYWMFRAIPGLSTAIGQELQAVAPMRIRSRGGVPAPAGLAARATCILALIPYAQPIALCFFVAWMLIANNAIHRLIRFNEELARSEENG